MSKSYSIGKMDGMWGSDESGNIAQTITFRAFDKKEITSVWKFLNANAIGTKKEIFSLTIIVIMAVLAAKDLVTLGAPALARQCVPTVVAED